MKMLGKRFFRDLGPNVVNLYRKHTFEEARDSDGKKFDKYTKEYSKAKRSGKLKRQATQFKDSRAPVLTGDLYRDFKLQKISREGITFGTTTQGGTVRMLAKNGRNLTTAKNPIPKDIQKFIIKEADEWIMKQMKRNFKSKTRVYRIKFGK